MTIEELLVSLGFELDSSSKKTIKEFQKDIDSSIKIMKRLAVATLAGTTALTAFVKVMSNYLDTLGKNARVLDISAATLDNLGFAMEIATGKSDGLNSSLQQLTRISSEAARGVGGGVEIFGLLGVEVLDAQGNIKKVDKLLLEILETTEKLDAVRRIEYLEKLGLGDLSLSSKDLGDFKKALQEAAELSIVSEEDTQKAARFNDMISRGMRVLRDFGILITSTVSPVFSDVIDSFKEWLLMNREFIRQDIAATFKTVGKFLLVMLSILGKIFNFGVKIVRMLGGLNMVLKMTIFLMGILAAFAVGKALLGIVGMIKVIIPLLTAMNVRLLLIPTIIGGLIAIIVLAFDELVTFAKGGETLFDRLFKKFPVFGDTIIEVIAGIMKVWDSFVELVKDPFSGHKWKEFFNSITELFGATLEEFGNMIFNSIKAIVEPISKFLRDAGLMGGETISKGEGGLGKKRPGMFEGTSKLALQMQQARRAGANSSLQSIGPRSAGSTNFNSTQKVDVTIRGDASGVDKKALESAVKEAVTESNREALRDLESGINK